MKRFIRRRRPNLHRLQMTRMPFGGSCALRKRPAVHARGSAFNQQTLCTSCHPPSTVLGQNPGWRQTGSWWLRLAVLPTSYPLLVARLPRPLTVIVSSPQNVSHAEEEVKENPCGTDCYVAAHTRRRDSSLGGRGSCVGVAVAVLDRDQHGAATVSVARYCLFGQFYAN